MTEISFNKEDLHEKVLSAAQRFSAKMRLKRNLKKILLGRKRMKYRLPSPLSIEKRARKLFRKKIETRVRRDKIKKNLSYQERKNLEMMVDKIMSNPSIQDKMIQWTKPGGKLYAAIYGKAKEKLKSRLSKK